MKFYKYLFRLTVLSLCSLILLPRTLFASPTGFVYLLCGPTNCRVYQFSQEASGQITLMNPPYVSTGKSPIGGAVTPSGLFFYTLNDGTISEFNIGENGLLKPMRKKAIAAPRGGTIVIPRGGKYLYELDYGNSITCFKIGADGQLKRLPFVTATDKDSLSMTFDCTGRFAYVLQMYGFDAPTGAESIDQYRVSKNGRLRPLKPWFPNDACHYGSQIFASATKPYIYVPDKDGLNEFRVSPSGQLVNWTWSQSYSQVFGLVDERLGYAVSTAYPYERWSDPYALTTTTIGSGKEVKASPLYVPDYAGVLEETSGGNPAAMVGFASMVLDPRKHIVYAMDELSFKIFRYQINPNGTITQLFPPGLTGHAPDPRNSPEGYSPADFYSEGSNSLLFVPKK